VLPTKYVWPISLRSVTPTIGESMSAWKRIDTAICSSLPCSICLTRSRRARTTPRRSPRALVAVALVVDRVIVQERPKFSSL
jgi:hypothetical protein